MEGVAFEAERRPGYCSHVADPKPPTMLFGCRPSEAARIAAERANQAVDADGKQLRADGLVFLGGVASFPVGWEEIRKNEAESARLRLWLAYLIEFLKQHYGASLHYVLLHTDEAYPHIHWGAVPELEPGRRMRISSVHAGQAAYEKARAEGRSNSAGRAAYVKAMQEWQDTIHVAVYAPLGIARVGPRRQRLSRGEYNARLQAEMALARTLAKEQELKAKWREEIRAEIAAESSGELGRWKQLCADQKSRLVLAELEIAELRARLCELQSHITTPSAATP